MATKPLFHAEPLAAHLYNNTTRRDAVYHLALEECETGWTVLSQWGARGSTLAADYKCERANYEDAKRIYDSTLKQKVGRAYQPEDQATADYLEALMGEKFTARIPAKKPATRVVSSAEIEAHPNKSLLARDYIPGPALTKARRPVSKQSVFTPELLTRCEQREVIAYSKGNRYWFQLKQDGIRLTVVRDGDSVYGYNKLGQIVPVDGRLHAAIMRLTAKARVTRIILDGEWEGDGYHAWDVLEVGGMDCRNLVYSERYETLREMFASVKEPLLHVVETAKTPEEKVQFLKRAIDKNAEGITIKDTNAMFRPGRNGQHFKFKFEQTASFIVGPKPGKKAHDGHRSVAVYLYDKAILRFMGTVKVADKYDVPDDGSIIEVRYLYCHPGKEGKIFQPVYFGKVRTDVKKVDCTIQQLRFKQ